jgi:glycine cleavage system H lipoate-binding protein
MPNLKKRKSGRPNVFALSNDQCVWAKAGLVKPMVCINAFDCLGCAFDNKVQADFKAKRKEAGSAVHAHKTPRMSLLESQGKCRHMLSGRVDYKMCAHNYNCVKCPYDQMIDDSAIMPSLTAPVCDPVSGFSVARDHYFHYGHTWARVEYGGRVRVGIDDFALRLLGPQDEIKLPRLGASVEQNRPQATLVREKNEAETMSPLDGTVVAVNPHIASNPKQMNGAPYGDGWLMVIQPKNLRKSLKNLLYGVESMAWTDDEASRLTSMLNDEGGYRMAATGGEAVADIFGAVPEIGWDRLVDAFLK